jgi:nucleoside-diphosphate-sugar epimerase
MRGRFFPAWIINESLFELEVWIMRILLTGALGNIGRNALEELLRQGHHVRCFDLKTRSNIKAAAALRYRAEVQWGDLRNEGDVAKAVRDQEVVVHLAFVIPQLSATGRGSEEYPKWAEEINVGGTLRLIEAAKNQPHPPKFVFASSVHVYGRTQDQPPPRKVDDPVRPIEHYSRHKVLCEEHLRSSGLSWAVLRFAAALPFSVRLEPVMFDIPLANRMEFVHTKDAGLAVANAATSREIWGRTWLIGGGPRCQYRYREIVQTLLSTLGIGMLPEEAFGADPFCTDWLDTEESQRVLRYQRYDLMDFASELKRRLGWRRLLTRPLRPVVRRWLAAQSPYYSEAMEKGSRGRRIPRLAALARRGVPMRLRSSAFTVLRRLKLYQGASSL